MINSEIFKKWWEYFLVIWWGFAHPKSEKLLGRENVKINVINEQYKERIECLLNSDKQDIKSKFEEIVDKRCIEEEERKKTIENKAHSLIGQTSIAVSFLLAALSLGTFQYNYFPIYFKIIIWIIFFLIILNFVTAGLHARNVVTVLKGFAYQDFDIYLDKNKTNVDIFIEKIFISSYNSYLNDVKATYLRFSHWFFKFSFIVTVIIALLLPPSLMMINNSNKIFSKNDIKNIEGISNTLNNYDNKEKNNETIFKLDTLMK